MRHVDLNTEISFAETALRDEAHDPRCGTAAEDQPLLVADSPSARELAMWLRALPSFFNVHYHPLAEAEHAERLTRNWNNETSIAQHALLRSSHLVFDLIQCRDDACLDAELRLAKPTETLAAVSSEMPPLVSNVSRSGQRIDVANTVFFELLEVLNDLRSICAALLESREVSFGSWAGFGKVLTRELECSALTRQLERGVDATSVHPTLLDLTVRLTPDTLGVSVRHVFAGLADLLLLLSFIERDLQRDYSLKLTLPIFTLINQETRRLLELFKMRVMHPEKLGEEAFDAIDSTSYAIRMELRKVFALELPGLSRQRHAPSIRSKVENAHGLLRDSFQQSTVMLARAFDPMLDGSGLFNSFQTKVEQSLALRRDLWTVLQFVRHAEKESGGHPFVSPLEQLVGFRDGGMRYLMYKDWETYERFTEEVGGARGAVELTSVLHRFGTYLETLFGQIGMRSVLADHPFEFPKTEN